MGHNGFDVKPLRQSSKAFKQPHLGDSICLCKTLSMHSMFVWITRIGVIIVKQKRLMNLLQNEI